jgi:hypothetical protein
MRHLKTLLLLASVVPVYFFTSSIACCSADAGELIFEGFPTKKIELTEQASATFNLTKKQSEEFKVVIARDGDNYFWVSRENTQVVPMQSGVYITFVAINGSGYVRVLSGVMREMFKSLPEEEKMKNYLYMEHLVHQMGSITYYGR